MGLPPSVTNVFLCILRRTASFSCFVISVPDFSVFLLLLHVEEGYKFLHKTGNWLLEAAVSHLKYQRPSESKGFRTRSSKRLFCAFGRALAVMCSGRCVRRWMQITGLWGYTSSHAGINRYSIFIVIPCNRTRYRGY